MENKTIAVVLGAVLILVLGALGVAVIVTSGDDATPEPAVTQSQAPTPTPTPTPDGDEFLLSVLEKTWDQTSYSDKQSLCALFNYAPEQAWNAFDSGSDNLVPKETFMEFFSGKCSSIT